MKELLRELRPELAGIFQYLHENPEISWNEYGTTAYIADLLRKYDFTVQTFSDCPGLIVEIGDGPYTVGLRTDIDALWQEVDGEYRANHSCGHDAHMTMAIGVLLLVKKLNYIPKNGKIKVIFQPAEEKGTGALKLVEKGVVDDIDLLYGVHLRPIQELTFGMAAPAIIHGAAKFISGKILGEDAHGARPHLGHNAIEIGAAFIQELSKIHLDPMTPYSVKMTKFHAGGESSNIIPGRAVFSIDARAQSNQVMNQLIDKVLKIAKALELLYDVTIELETKASVAAAEVDLEAQHLMNKAIVDVVGKENAMPPVMTTGGEDFHFYTLKRSHLKATMLGLGCDLQPGLHHPHMTFEHEAIYTGIEILTKVVLYSFESHERRVHHGA